MPAPDADKFLSECWTIVRGLGKEDEKTAARARVAWGVDTAGATCYRDKLIEIVAEAEPSKRILVTKLDTRNPVIATDKDGRVSRWHGEAYRVAAHVHILAVGLQDD
jgi:hypothetical protein